MSFGCARPPSTAKLSQPGIDAGDGIVYDTIMIQVVVDTSVLVAAPRSKRGASYRLLTLVGKAGFEINVSVPLVLEYEDAAKRPAPEAGLSNADIDDILDYLCSVANRHAVHFLWRPVLKDPGDDHVLELAVRAECSTIVTHNTRDFSGSEDFGVEVLTPGEFLRRIGGSR